MAPNGEMPGRAKETLAKSLAVARLFLFEIRDRESKSRPKMVDISSLLAENGPSETGIGP